MGIRSTYPSGKAKYMVRHPPTNLPQGQRNERVIEGHRMPSRLAQKHIPAKEAKSWVQQSFGLEEMANTL